MGYIDIKISIYLRNYLAGVQELRNIKTVPLTVS